MGTTFRRYRKVRRRVRGWFLPEAAATWDCLLDYQRETEIVGNLLEIGVWHGKSSALLAMHAQFPGESVVLVDLWIRRAKIERTLDLAGTPENSFIHIVEANSAELDIRPYVPDFEKSFRFAHIDGEHSARALRNDLGLAHELLAEDGVVCIDDFFSEAYPQITAATFRYLSDHPDRFTLFLCGFNKGYMTRPDAAAGYLRYCRDKLHGAMRDRRCAVTLFKTTDPADMNCFGMKKRKGTRPPMRGPDGDVDKIEI